MIKDKEWLEENVRENASHYPTYHDERDDLVKKMVDMHGVLGLIEQLDEPEKVVIPEFVAEWILINKNIEIDYAFKLINNRTKAGSADDFDKWVKKNKNLFAHAFVAGYSIEQPKLLTIIIKDYDKTLHKQQVPKEVANEIVKLLQSTQREVTE